MAAIVFIKICRSLKSMSKERKTINTILDPADRISEIFFGLIMVLSVIVSLHVAQGGPLDAHIAALGCNLAWGLIDGAIYVVGRVAQRGHEAVLARQVRNARDPAEARRVISDALPSSIAAQLPDKELDLIRFGLMQRPESTASHTPTTEDWLGGFYIFLMVFLTTFPVVLPFMLIKDSTLALRVSHGITLSMLYLSGYGLGRYTGFRPWRVGLFVTFIGLAMVALTLVLGG
jgi:VIT1/CCC1 family predicted Fe2+/Mn2+ transporter